MLKTASQIKKLLTGKNPQTVFDSMMRTNPQFAEFVNANKDKSLHQLAQEYGIDPNTLKSLFE